VGSGRASTTGSWVVLDVDSGGRLRGAADDRGQQRKIVRKKKKKKSRTVRYSYRTIRYHLLVQYGTVRYRTVPGLMQS
jgi:hypothetical protein